MSGGIRLSPSKILKNTCFRRSHLSFAKVFPLSFVIIGLLLGCLDPIVGAECREGLHYCNGECIKFDTYENCGACGYNCGPFICVDGRCDWTQWRTDSGYSPTDAGVDGDMDSGPDANQGDASDSGPTDVADTSLPEDVGLTDACPIGQMECDGECVSSSAEHCGSCDNACEPGEFCAGGQCVGECENNLTLCGTVCVDTLWDPNHCGRCNNRCLSGICAAGACADATAGHLVVIGHNFSNATTVMQRLAGNSVFLAVGAPVRVLVFEGDALPESIEGTDRAVEVVANQNGRTWERRAAIDGLVTLQLATADVFLVYAQQNATNSELEKYGESWGLALTGFLRQGGVVVLFDGAGDNQGTYQILQPAQIFQADEIAEISGGTTLTVEDLSDQIALNVPQRYVSRGETVFFDSVSTPGNVVVRDPDEMPVIVHRVIFN
ncbi:MAG: hypothetical protein JXA30_09805 [Deltaproteobacteria bacterium]|nr:hypothetical protein [Deltaproteobacteria bacterium]